jgi:hypothetical protein
VDVVGAGGVDAALDAVGVAVAGEVAEGVAECFDGGGAVDGVAVEVQQDVEVAQAEGVVQADEVEGDVAQPGASEGSGVVGLGGQGAVVGAGWPAGPRSGHGGPQFVVEGEGFGDDGAAAGHPVDGLPVEGVEFVDEALAAGFAGQVAAGAEPGGPAGDPVGVVA